ncbi:MAG: SsrA-binding protein SmpB [Candidatus Gracilibacteria bacterium]
MKKKKSLNNLITKNKKAYFNYEITDSWEAGIELRGYETKSVRNGHVNLRGAYVVVINNELYVKGMHISAWKALPNRETVETEREIKIFLHKKTINFLLGKSREAGYSIIPLELYFVGSLIKLRVGLAKGKKAYQKKQILKERTMDKEAKVAMKKFI